MSTPSPTTGLVPDRPGPPRPKSVAAAPQRLGDRVFSGLATTSGVLILVVLAGVALFLITESLPVFGAAPDELPGDQGFLSYLGPLVFGTLLAATLALLIATGLVLFVITFAVNFAARAVLARRAEFDGAAG